MKKQNKSTLVRLYEGFFVGLGIGVGILFMQLLSVNAITAINIFLNYTGLK